MNNTTFFIFLTFASIGFVQVLEGVWKFFISPRKAVECYNILTIKGRVDDMEQLLRWFLSRSWDRFLGDGQFIIVDLGMDMETLDLCKRFIADREEVELCTEQEFTAQLGQTDVYKTFRYVLY